MTARTQVPDEFQDRVQPSPKQVPFIRRLVNERDLSSLDQVQIKWLSEQLVNDDANAFVGVPVSRASDIINKLLTLPKKDPWERSDTPDVPAGRYAVENEDGVLRFYVVDRPTEGRWAGFIFLSVMASDEKHPIKGEAKNVILKKIAVDPKAAMQRYGYEIGRCGICGRTLTNEESRRLGIGPICAGKQGWL
jgi:Family of unknown function (DUF6011)